MKALPRSRVEGVTAPQWARLERLCRTPGVKLEEAHVRSFTGMTAKAALAVILRVSEDEDGAERYWLVFHGDHQATRRRFATGFQPVPWRCLECGELVEDADDLRYEVQAVLRTPFVFP